MAESGKAHIHDIQNHPGLSYIARAMLARIVESGCGTVEEFDVIRKEWERLGQPLCQCGCNQEVN